MTESADRIEEEAFAWVARLDRHGRGAGLEAELEAWLAGDARRRGAFLRAEALWGRLDVAAEADGPLPRSLGPDRRRLAFGVAGAALAAAVAGVFVVELGAPYQTAIGEVRHMPLADGSRMVLNTDSRAHVALRSAERRVRLSSGEAWFHVAKDRARPFVVEAGRVRVRAVGTAFSVRRLENGAEVLVSEGVVEAWIDGAEAEKKRVSAGEKARVLEGRPIEVVLAAASEIDRKLAWRSVKIDLDGETLDEAIAEFNRFNRRKLVLSSSGLGAHLGSRRLYGVFRADDPEAFARSAALSLGAKVEFAPDRIAIGG